MRRVHVSMFALGLLVASFVAGHAGVASAQTQFVPYFGKNNIHYDQFDWKSYETEHFTIWFYPEIEKHLERIAGYAESAYQQISADLKHDLPTATGKVQLVLFKTHSEFEQQNVAPGRRAGRRRRVCRAGSPAHAHADRRSAGSALRPHRPRADAPVPVRHHPAGADPAQRAAVGE